MQKTTLILQPAPTTANHGETGEPTDEMLMGRIQKRDEDALTMLYYRHGKLLRSVISRCGAAGLRSSFWRSCPM